MQASAHRWDGRRPRVRIKTCASTWRRFRIRGKRSCSRAPTQLGQPPRSCTTPQSAKSSKSFVIAHSPRRREKKIFANVVYDNLSGCRPSQRQAESLSYTTSLGNYFSYSQAIFFNTRSARSINCRMSFFACAAAREEDLCERGGRKTLTVVA